MEPQAAEEVPRQRRREVILPARFYTRDSYHIDVEELGYFTRTCSTVFASDARFKEHAAIDLAAVNVYWCPHMADDGATLGCFCAVRPNDVYLADFRGQRSMMVPVLVHELTHMLQLQRMGFFKYSLCKFPFVKRKMLEAEATDFEDLTELKMAELRCR